MAAESTYIKNSCLGVFTLNDGSAVPVTLALNYDLGDTKITNFSQVLNELIKVRRRGKRVSEVWGDKLDPVLTFSCYVGNLVSSTLVKPGTPWEFMTFKGAYSGNTSTSPNAAGSRPKTIGITLTFEGTDYGDANDESVKLNDCLVSGEFSEGMQGNRLSFTAEVLGSVSHTNGGVTVTYTGI